MAGAFAGIRILNLKMEEPGRGDLRAGDPVPLVRIARQGRTSLPASCFRLSERLRLEGTISAPGGREARLRSA